ncbi:MAG TPA: hydroxymethylbilane synthase [Methanocellales archaeon]|nr:hydroxymethylbilane synthase [Methanocellales archaeon]
MIIGSRGSALALAQTEIVRALLRKKGIESDIRIVKTTGDTFADRPLREFSGLGVFIREIDEMMLEGEIDAAVHSMKDLPTERPKELVVAAVLRRSSPYDALVSDYELDELPRGAVIGTSSMRRRAQLLRLRSDLVIQNIRGNVDTRLRKLRQGDYDAIIVAEAALDRLNLPVEVKRLPFIPSANQGAIAVVTKKDTDAEECIRVLDHRSSRIETEVERTILKVLGGGCIVPMGILAQANDEITVQAEVLSPDGDQYVSIKRSIQVGNYGSAAVEIGTELKNKGGTELIEETIKRMRG